MEEELMHGEPAREEDRERRISGAMSMVRQRRDEARRVFDDAAPLVETWTGIARSWFTNRFMLMSPAEGKSEAIFKDRNTRAVLRVNLVGGVVTTSISGLRERIGTDDEIWSGEQGFQAKQEALNAKIRSDKAKAALLMKTALWGRIQQVLVESKDGPWVSVNAIVKAAEGRGSGADEVGEEARDVLYWVTARARDELEVLAECEDQDVSEALMLAGLDDPTDAQEIRMHALMHYTVSKKCSDLAEAIQGAGEMARLRRMG